MTAASTSNSSHFHGARNEPSIRGASSEWPATSAPLGGSFSGESCSWGVSASNAASAAGPSDSSSARENTGGFQGGDPLGSSAGTCPSDRYSANRRAESRSTPHESKARKALPAGSGRRVLRAKNDGMPARFKALSSRLV